jgi:hypothetical protein
MVAGTFERAESTTHGALEYKDCDPIHPRFA